MDTAFYLNDLSSFRGTLYASNEWKSGRIVDQDGKAGTPEGQELIKQIAIKLGGDLSSLLNQPPVGTSEHWRRIVRDIRQAATWLFAEAPPEVIGYLKTRLDEDGEQSERDIIEAAGRSFTATDDQYLCQLQKTEGGLSGMNTTQAGDLVENLA